MVNFLYKNKKNKKVLILFLHDSTGELFVTLPFFWFLKKKLDVEIYFVSSHKDILKRMKVSSRYIEIMNQIGSLHFGTLNNIRLLFNLLNRNNLIIQMSCNLGARRIDRIYYSILKKSTKLFFTHAFMLHSLNKIKNIASNNELKSLINSQFLSFYGKKADLLIINSQETNYLTERGWSLNALHTVGSYGYNKDWLNYLLKSDIPKLQKEDKKRSLDIFVPLRDCHNIYLTKKNYDFLIDSLTEVFKFFPNFKFTVKLHPRQQPKDILEIFSKFNNVSFSNKSPFELALKSDLTIGFWSSALTDSVAVGTPAIEFFKHEIPHPQLVTYDNKLISLNQYLGLCRGFNNSNQLQNFLSNLNYDQIKKLQDDQYSMLIKYFNIDKSFENKILGIFEDHFKKASLAHLDQRSEKSILILVKNFVSKIFSIPRRIF
tara:strand:+ start:3008 stop:4300 length:1293 start_codon:yes stop_codon:yes gene_type:complete